MFEFDESLEGYIKTAVFYHEKQKVYYAVLENEDKCFILAPAIVKVSPLYIGVFVTHGNKLSISLGFYLVSVITLSASLYAFRNSSYACSSVNPCLFNANSIIKAKSENAFMYFVG